MITYLNISPVVFAVSGLILFILGQFARQRLKICLSIVGLLFILFFFYKLTDIYKESQITTVYANRESAGFHLPYLEFFPLIIIAGILGLALWSFVILKVAFNEVLPKQLQLAILMAGGLILIASFVVYSLFGNLIGIIFLPILTIGFYISFKLKYRRILK